MRSKDLTELAQNSDFISGVYNYCDRWCERCPLTSRCLLYARDKEDDDVDDDETRDINNEKFWRKIRSIFEETRQLVETWANEAGVDLTQIDHDAIARQEKRSARSRRHTLAVAGKKYASAVDEWFRSCDEIGRVSDAQPEENELEAIEQVQAAREIIRWYQYQIAVKIMRALSSRVDEVEWEAGHCLPRDSDGSVKVALIGIDRSVSAWRLIQIALPDQSGLIVPLILSLERLRRRVEKRFPDARAFIRPGFDEILGEPN